MTIAELIEALQKHPMDAEVHAYDNEEGWYPVSSAVRLLDDSSVYGFQSVRAPNSSNFSSDADLPVANAVGIR